MNNVEFGHLKHVPPIDNPAPNIHPGDKPWSEVFERAAKQFDARTAGFGLCLAVSEELGVGISYNTKGKRQADRMTRYIANIMQSKWFVSDWLERHNGNSWSHLDLYAYRAAWARHLAAQFRAKGL